MVYSSMKLAALGRDWLSKQVQSERVQSALSWGRSKLPRWSSEDLSVPGVAPAVGSLILSTLTINLLSLALPITTLQVYDRILPNNGTGTMIVLGVAVCVAVALETCLRLARTYVLGRTGAAYEHRMSVLAIQKVLNADLNKVRVTGVGEFLHRLNSVGRLKEFQSGYVIVTLTELAFVPLFLILIYYISGWLVLVPLLVLAGFGALSAHRGLQLRGLLKAREDADDDRFDALVESLEGMHTLKAYGLEALFARRYEALEDRSVCRNFDVSLHTSHTYSIGSISSNVMVALVISAGAWFVLNGHLTNGGLIATLLLSGRLMQPIQKGLALFVRYQGFRLAEENVRTLISAPQHQTLERKNEYECESHGDLELRDVTFSYGDNEVPLLRGIDLKVRRGEAVLITGAHGSGKSTLLKLAAGILRPDGGRIELDGEDIGTFEQRDIPKHVGLISTNPSLIRGTIRDNISCFDLSDRVKVNEVARLMKVDVEVAKMAAGFETFLHGSQADSIPPGLRQRIAITRALAEKPRLILFDNADISLDLEGYELIYRMMAQIRSQVGMIICSDDENMRALTDRHYHLVNGRLEAGHKQRKGSAYKHVRGVF